MKTHRPESGSPRQKAGRPGSMPDLSRQAFLARLTCPAPRSEDPHRMLTQPPRLEPGNQSPARLPRHRRETLPATALLLTLQQERRKLSAAGLKPRPALLSAALLNTALSLTELQREICSLFQAATVPGLNPGQPPPQERLLPLENYEPLRRRLEPLLEEHRRRREEWLAELLPRQRRQAAAAGQPPPEEQALRQKWQAQLKLRRVPTLAEFLDSAGDPALRGVFQTLYQQAARQLRQAKALPAPNRPF